MRGAAQPSAEGMLSWLASASVIAADGGVISWASAEHPGYAYPEAAGLLLALFANENVAPTVGDRIARRLAADANPAGGIGRRGAFYAFDTAVALSGLFAHAKVARAFDIARGFDFLASRLEARAPVELLSAPPLFCDASHWSLTYGSHLLKTAIALERVGAEIDRARSQRLVDQLLRDLLPLEKEGRFVTHAGATITYLHGACYATEGLLWLRDRGRTDLGPVVHRAAAWLAEAQTRDGGLRAWNDGHAGSGERHADVSAQAIRIWAAVDPRAYATQIHDELRFLATLQGRDGGIRYHRATNDVNTWCTAFALQATRWVAEGADVARML